jgi:hypothetical protein
VRHEAVGTAVAICVAVIAPCSTAPALQPQQSASTVATRSPTLALAKSGVSAETAVAAGVSSAEVADLVTRAAIHVRDTQQSTAAAEAALTSARVALRAAEAQRVHAAAEAAQAACVSARESLAAAEEAVSALREQFLEAALANLSAATRERLRVVLSNRKWGVPTKYLVVARTDSEWTHLREALRAVSNSSRGLSDEQIQQAQAIVSAADCDPEVAASGARLQSGLAAAAQSWATAEAAALRN